MNQTLFNVSRRGDMFTKDGLGKFLGLGPEWWPDVALKELVDNSLDAVENLPYPWVGISCVQDESGVMITVSDNGPGISQETIVKILDTETRTSSNIGFIGPSRGKQGNAWPSLLGMMGALWEGKAPPIIIESRGLRHLVTVEADAVGEAQVNHRAESCSNEETTVSIRFPTADDALEALALSYQVWNPHVSFTIDGVDFPSKVLGLKKWCNGDPTSPHWYQPEDFDRLVSYLRTAEPDTTVRNLVRRFKGLTSTAAARKVADSVTAQTVAGLDQPGKLLAQMQAHSKPVNPTALGVLGKDALTAELVINGSAAGYGKAEGTWQGKPWVFEIAIARSVAGTISVGVNHSAALLRDPFSQVLFPSKKSPAEGLSSLLKDYRVNPDEGFQVQAHFIDPSPTFMNASKTLIHLHAEIANLVAEAVKKAAGQAKKGSGRAPKANLKDGVFYVLRQAISEASGDGRYEFPIRNLFYSVRPLLQQVTDATLDYNYFSQTLVTEYEQTYGEIEGLFRDPRGHLIHPHGGHRLALGTREVRGYELPEWAFDKILYIEKKGLIPILEAARLAERYDLAIVAAEGYASRAARELLKRAEGKSLTILCLHDADPAGYEISRTLGEATRSMPHHSINVIDIGLFYSEAVAMGLQVEEFTRSKELPSTLVLSPVDFEAFQGDQVNPKTWRARRVELNALAAQPERLITYIENKLKEHGCAKKVVPPVEVLAQQAEQAEEESLKKLAWEILRQEFGLDDFVDELVSEHRSSTNPAALAAKLRAWALENKPEPWEQPLQRMADGQAEASRDSLLRAVHGKKHRFLNKS